MQPNSFENAGETPSEFPVERSFREIAETASNFTIHTDVQTGQPVVPVNSWTRRNPQPDLYRFEDTIGANNAISRSIRFHHLRGRQGAYIDPLSHRTSHYGSSIQSRVPAEMNNEIDESSTETQVEEDSADDEEQPMLNLDHLPPVFKATGDRPTDEDKTDHRAYDIKFKKLMKHYTDEMGPPMTLFQNGQSPVIPSEVAKQQAKCRQLREHQLLDRVSRPLFPYASGVVRAGMRSEKEKREIERNKERRRRELEQQEQEMHRGGPYAVDNYQHGDLQSTGVEPEWPGLIAAMHDTPISSRDISTFIIRENTPIFAKLDPTGTAQIKELDRFLLEIKEEPLTLSDLTLPVNYKSFPQKMTVRKLQEKKKKPGNGNEVKNDSEPPVQVSLRPILLDGCAVAYAWDDTFLPKWHGKTSNLPYCPSKVLPVYPIVLATLRLILQGHKVQIVLPEYYKVPYRRESKRIKVDNLYAFNKLVDLNLIKWLEPEDDEDSYDGGNFMDMIGRLSLIDSACIIGCDIVKQEYDRDKSQNYNEVEDYADYDIADHIKQTNQNLLIQDRIKGHSSERYLSVQFIGDTKDLVIYDEFSFFVGRDANDHENRKNGYSRVKADTTMFYTENEGDVKSGDIIRVTTQLEIREQIRLVLELADLYPLPVYDLHGVMVFLRFAFQKFEPDLVIFCTLFSISQGFKIFTFLHDHPPFPDPTEADFNGIDVESVEDQAKTNN